MTIATVLDWATKKEFLACVICTLETSRTIGSGGGEHYRFQVMQRHAGGGVHVVNEFRDKKSTCMTALAEWKSGEPS